MSFFKWRKQADAAELDPLLNNRGRSPDESEKNKPPAVDASMSLNKDGPNSLEAGMSPLHSQKLRYFSRLAPAHRSNLLLIPRHVISLDLFVVGGAPGKPGTQSSLITILSLWNTMMGTSMLAMPWALNQAGFGLGITCMFFMAGLACFTCLIIIRSGEGGRMNGEEVEFSDVCRFYLGDKAYYTAIVFAVLTFAGASIVYWVLMSSFLYNTIDYFHNPHATDPVLSNATFANTSAYNGTITAPHSTWHDVWSTTTAPIFLALLVFPLINFKSLTFFTKFNSLGVFSILYIIFFVVSNAGIYAKDAGSPIGGMHLDNVPEAKSTFVMLTGVLSLSYFIHNGALSIMRNQRNPENNTRDLMIAYFLVCTTYLIVGLCFFISFRGNKDEIKSNLLDNFDKNNSNFMWALVAQLFLLFQMITVYPLLQYITRFQIMTTFFGGNAWPSLGHVLAHNVVQTGLGILIAIFYPKIGDILRYTGAGCGLAYVFALPALVQLKILNQKGTRAPFLRAACYAIMIIGVLNFIGQFLV